MRAAHWSEARGGVMRTVTGLPGGELPDGEGAAMYLAPGHMVQKPDRVW